MKRYEEPGDSTWMVLLVLVTLVTLAAILLNGCTQRHYKGVIMDGNCEYREVPGGTPEVVCPDGGRPDAWQIQSGGQR